MPEEQPSKSRQTFASAAAAGRKLERLRSRLREERKARAAAEAEREDLKKKAPAEEVARQLEAARGQLRERDHRSAFDKACDAAKVRPEARDDLWAVAKLDTGSDKVNADAIGQAVGKALESRPYLVAEGHQETAAPRPLERSPEGERGGKSAEVGKVRYKAVDVADPVWQARNHVQFNKDLAEGKAAIVD